MAVTNATKTVVGVFDTMAEAQTVVRELENAGFSRDEISVVANKNVTSEYESATGAAPDTTSNVVADAGIGAAIGGVGGLLLSFAGLAIPGIGPILAAGPIVAALSGAGIGAVAGGLIGALTESGIPEEDAKYYAEGVRRGHVLVTVRSDSGNVDRAQEIMDRHGAVDVENRASDWRGRGWSGYNPGAEPLSSDELQRERQYYSSANRQGDDWSNRTAHDIGDSTRNLGASARETGRDMKEGAEDAARATGRGIRDAATGTKDAMEDAGRSIRRGASRVYDRMTR